MKDRESSYIIDSKYINHWDSITDEEKEVIKKKYKKLKYGLLRADLLFTTSFLYNLNRSRN